jgi:hypothetical protein
MIDSKASSDQGLNEKSPQGVERQLTPEDDIRAEILEDDGEVFKANAGQTQFRALGL